MVYTINDFTMNSFYHDGLLYTINDFTMNGFYRDGLYN